MSFAWAQLPVSRPQEHEADSVRNRSQSESTDCEALRLQKRVTGSGRACETQKPARGTTCTDRAEHFLSLHESTRCHRARPLGSRLLLAQGLLRTSRPRRFSCQGIDSLPQVKFGLHRLKYKATEARFANRGPNQASLHGAVRISQGRQLFFCLSGAPRAYAGAEGQQ